MIMLTGPPLSTITFVLHVTVDLLSRDCQYIVTRRCIWELGEDLFTRSVLQIIGIDLILHGIVVISRAAGYHIIILFCISDFRALHAACSHTFPLKVVC